MTINKDFSSAVVEDLVSRCVNTAEEGGDLGASIVENLKETFEIFPGTKHLCQKSEQKTSFS